MSFASLSLSRRLRRERNEVSRAVFRATGPSERRDIEALQARAGVNPQRYN